MAQQKLTFSIIVSEAPMAEDSLAEAVEPFSEIFHLEQGLSERILRSTPVIFLEGLTRGQVSSIKPLLTSVSEQAPISFRVSSADVPPLPRLEWSEKPDYDHVEDGDVLTEVRLTYNGNTISCPSCDEELLLNPPVRDLPVADSTGHAELQNRSPDERSDAGSHHEKEAGEAAEELSSRPDSHGPDQEQEMDVDELEETQEMSTPGEQMQKSTQEPEGTEDVEMEDVPDLFDEEEADDTFDEIEQDEDDFMSELDDELSDLDDMDFEQEGAEGEGAEPSTAPEADAAVDKRYNVFISGSSEAKEEQILSLLTEIRGCSSSEARDLMSRPITPVANDVPQARVQEIQKRFDKIGVQVSITER